MANFTEKQKKMMRNMQREEMTLYLIYKKMSKRMNEPRNKRVMNTIAQQEKKHAENWQAHTGEAPKPRRYKAFFFLVMSIVLGYTFVLRLMEKKETKEKAFYASLSETIPQIGEMVREEETHAQEIIDTIDEERLRYIRSIVLGLNDALVELTGALAGLTLAIVSTEIISLSGLITGIAASLSMAASEYLSTHATGRKDALKSSIYTGSAYIIVVMMLIMPYLLMDNRFTALATTLAISLTIIFVFNYYLSVTLKLSFKKRFTQMAVISLSIAAFSFLLGLVLGQLFGVDI